jgi:hypothetical protein
MNVLGEGGGTQLLFIVTCNAVNPTWEGWGRVAL